MTRMRGESSKPASAPTSAVFLSYASQDAGAARRICDALRASGIEVWFDQSELRGGDSWDRKIREQIHNCRLFIPVVSANTERRDEGYFRREWALAVERTRDMLHKKTFLVPVVIDATPERGSAVPEKFHELQWTRLPGGEAPPAFVERVVALLGLVGQANDSTSVAPTVEAGSTQHPSGASIGVLPFASLSSDPERDYFGDGIAEELIHLLTRVPGLKVPARTSSFAYKGRNTDARQIARDLGVRMLLEGSVRSAGDRIRVTAQLIEAESGYHAWSHSYERRFVDVFQLQDELAAAIVAALKLNLDDSAARPLREAPPTKNVEAYRLYLQARSLLGNVNFTRSIALLEESVALDPGFVRAHAVLAAAYIWQSNMGLAGVEVLDKARRSAERAVSLGPDTSEAHVALGVQHAVRCEWVAAETSLMRAIELNPREPYNYEAYALNVLGCVGKLKQALAASHTAYELAPARAAGIATLAGFSGLNGLNHESIRLTQLALDLGAQPLRIAPVFRSEAERRSGHYALACEHFLHALPAELHAQDTDNLVRLIYKALGEPGYATEAIEGLRAFIAKADPVDLESPPMPVMLFLWYELLGARDDAYETARRLVRAFNRTGFLNVSNLAPLWVSELRSFRADARFQTLVGDLGLLDYWKSRGAPDGYELRGDQLVPQVVVPE